MKVMAREDAWASTYFRTAINHCIEADKLLASIRFTNDLSQHMAIDESMNEAGAITIVFSAMCIEAYMNDYLAQAMGEETFYKHHERKSSTDKLNLVLGSDNLHGKDKVESAVKALFKERNDMVHAKSRDISYESAADDDQTQPTNITPDSIASAYWRNYCTDYATRANRAICAVLLLGEYMQRKEPSFRTDAFLLGLNAIPVLPLDIINKITKLCNKLGISLPIMPEYHPTT